MVAASRQDAARAALERQLRLARQGRSMLYPFIGRSRRFEAWQHYPRNDAMDVTGRWQFYFHAHDPAEADSARHPQEHGHIHLFRRNPMGRLSHLAGLSLDARGVPLTWFATNQWVTGERWMAAGALTRGLPDIELRLRGPLAGAALWLADMVRLYAGSLRQMVQQRDEALARHCTRKRVTPQQAWADRRVAVWSSFPVHWPQDALQLSGQLSSSHHTRSFS
jgi:hypothetical protein